jgi:hypothetical protein
MQRLAVSALGAATALAGTDAVAKMTAKTMAFTLPPLECLS